MKTDLTLNDYVLNGLITPQQKETLRDYIIQRKNILVVGGTGSGKTTFLQAMIGEIAKSVPHERVCIIDDVEELTPPKNGFLYNLTDGDIRQFLKSLALKSKPNRILINELRTDEQMVYAIQLCGTIRGGIFTIHGNSVISPFSRGDTEHNKVGFGFRKVVDVIIYLTRNGTNNYQVKEIVEAKDFRRLDSLTAHLGGDK